MMFGHGMAGVALVDEPWVPGDLCAAPVDPDFCRVLVDRDRLPDEALRHRVPVGLDRDVTVEVDNALECLIDWRQHAG
jgi:hypothetical protein